MSGNQPVPPSKRRQQHLLRTQNKFWDFINSIELPIIIFMQKHFKAYSTTSFWNFIAKMASPTKIRLLPMIFYSLGFEDQAKHLAISLVYFSLFSSFGKYLIVRRRPGSYEGVHSPACAGTSSFPSRHTISITIVAFFLPFTMIWIVLIIMSRIMLGMHFLTDCILGVFVGKLALFVAPLITDPNFCLFLLLVTFRVWSGAYKILSGSLPLLIVSPISSLACPSFRQSPLCIVLVLVWKLIRSSLPATLKIEQKTNQQIISGSSENILNSSSAHKRSNHSSRTIHSDYKSQPSITSNSVAPKKTSNPYELLLIELIPISFVVFLISESNKLLFCIRQIDFDNIVNHTESSCNFCSSHFTNYLFPLLFKYSIFQKIFGAIKTVDILSINLNDKIINFF